MNLKLILLLFVSIIILQLGCGKDEVTEDPHNHSLLNKSIDQIRAEIAGKWQLQRYSTTICGVAGCNTDEYSYPSGTGDIIFFRTNDTVQKVKYDYSLTYIYEKASVQKVRNWIFPTPPDSLYSFSMQSGYLQWLMKEIKNDTLLLSDYPYLYYLTRKQ